MLGRTPPTLRRAGPESEEDRVARRGLVPRNPARDGWLTTQWSPRPIVRVEDDGAVVGEDQHRGVGEEMNKRVEVVFCKF